MHARHVLGLARWMRSPRSGARHRRDVRSRVHALPHVADGGCLWPGCHWPLPQGAVVAACVVMRCCWMSRSATALSTRPVP